MILARSCISSPVRSFIGSPITRRTYQPCLITTSRTIVSKVDTFLRGGVDFEWVVSTQNLLVSLHNCYGTGNWALDVVAATLIMRTVISLPMMSWRINIFHSYAKMRARLKKQADENMKDQAKRFKAIIANADDRPIKQQLIVNRSQLKDEILRTNNHPLRGIIVIGFEAMAYVTFFLAIKNLCLGLPDVTAEIAQSELQRTSFLWLKDLTTSDPFHLFPLLAFVSALSTTEYMVQARKQNNIPNVPIFVIIKYAGRTISLVFFYLVLNAPSGIAVYFATSTTLGLIQVILLANAKFRSFLKIPHESGFEKQVQLRLWAKDIKNSIIRSRYKK